MSKMAAVNSPPFYLLTAISLTVAIFYLGGHPSTAGVFSPSWQGISHFVPFALMALFYGRGLPRVHPLAVVLLVIVIGGLHELYQSTTSAHYAELHDFFIDSAAALCGAVASRLPFALSLLKP